MQSLRITLVFIFVAALLAGEPEAMAQIYPQTGNGAPQPDQSPSVPPSVATAAQSSASRLTVRYEGGKLSVAAHGVTLHSVLELIGQRTGTAIESAPGTDAGQVYVELGPASVQEVLTDLLNGSPTNYLMLGSRSNPGFVERLIILARSGTPVAASSEAAMVATTQPAPKPKVYGAGFNTDHADNGASASSSTSVAAEEQQQPPSTALPPVQQTIDPSIAKYQKMAAEAAASGKSRAQILDDLQKLQIQELEAQSAAQARSH